MHTWCPNGQRTTLGENGALLVMGLEANPLFTILHGQIGAKMENFDVRCPIFGMDGFPISQERDDTVEKEFDDLVEASLTHCRNFGSNASDTAQVIPRNIFCQFSRNFVDLLWRSVFFWT